MRRGLVFVGPPKGMGPSDIGPMISVDQAIRSGLAGPGLRGALYVHRDRIPLADVDLGRAQADLFDNECEGVCGV